MSKKPKWRAFVTKLDSVFFYPIGKSGGDYVEYFVHSLVRKPLEHGLPDGPRTMRVFADSKKSKKVAIAKYEAEGLVWEHEA